MIKEDVDSPKSISLLSILHVGLLCCSLSV